MADKVALVTGANTGIGLAIAQRLLADGYLLGYATAGNDDKHTGPLADLQKEHGEDRIHWVFGDLSDHTVAEGFVADVVDKLGGLDVLVNNAGLSTAKPFLDLTVDDFDLTFDVDVRASFLLAQQAARHMKDHGGGSIVNITSVHEHIPRGNFAVYASAKAALGMLTRAMALELGRVQRARQRRRARRDRDAAQRSRRGTSSTPRCRSAGPASRRKSPRSSRSSAPTTPRISPARATSWTAE